MTKQQTDRIFEALDSAMLGVFAAVPLAWVAFAMQREGWHAACAVALPSYCAYVVGKHTARLKWMVVHEAQIAALAKQIDDVVQKAESNRGEP